MAKKTPKPETALAVAETPKPKAVVSVAIPAGQMPNISGFKARALRVALAPWITDEELKNGIAVKLDTYYESDPDSKFEESSYFDAVDLRTGETRKLYLSYDLRQKLNPADAGKTFAIQQTGEVPTESGKPMKQYAVIEGDLETE